MMEFVELEKPAAVPNTRQLEKNAGFSTCHFVLNAFGWWGYHAHDSDLWDVWHSPSSFTGPTIR